MGLARSKTPLPLCHPDLAQRSKMMVAQRMLMNTATHRRNGTVTPRTRLRDVDTPFPRVDVDVGVC
jgi:hypothetical protein